jgi:hypothetical protein
MIHEYEKKDGIAKRFAKSLSKGHTRVMKAQNDVDNWYDKPQGEFRKGPGLNEDERTYERENSQLSNKHKEA